MLDYLATYRPSIEIEDCLFSHVEPWRDLNDVLGLWYFDGLPDHVEKLARNFDACTQRVMFTGHVHRWFIATKSNVIPWDAAEPILLHPSERYLVMVAAVCEGRCGIFDTQIGELTPIRWR